MREATQGQKPVSAVGTSAQAIDRKGNLSPSTLSWQGRKRLCISRKRPRRHPFQSIDGESFLYREDDAEAGDLVAWKRDQTAVAAS